MTLRAVFLDVGNTLVRERPSRFAIYAQAALRHGCVGVDEKAMKALMREAHASLPLWIDSAFRYSDPWFRAFIERIFGRGLGLGPRSVELVTEELFERFERPASFEVFAGAHELLEGLRARGLILGVISNWSARLPSLLRALELDRHFHFVLCSALEQMEKPQATIFEAALQRAGVAPAQALHAGDHSENDVAGARRAGLEAVLVDHGGVAFAATGHERQRVESLPELEALVMERLD